MKPPVLTEMLRRSDAWVDLPSSAAIGTPARLGNHFRVILTENARLEIPYEPHDGQRILWRIAQDATGSRTLSISSGFRQTGNVVLTATALSVTIWEAMYDKSRDEWTLHGVPSLSAYYDPAGTAVAAIAASVYIAKAQGVVALVAGEATVTDSGVTAGSRFILSRQLLGTLPGHLSVDSRSNGVSFHILSSSITDDGTIFWQRFQP